MSVILLLVTVSCVMLQARPSGPDRRLDEPERRLAVLNLGDVFKVIYQAPTECLVKVTIKDDHGRVVFTERVSSDGGFTKPYNFSELPKGEYTLEVADPAGTHAETLSYQDHPWAARVVKVKGEAGKFVVAIPNPQHHEVSVRVFNQAQELVFSETVDDEFAKVYHLKNLNDATIQLVNHSTGKDVTFRTDK